jgi:hypothetical protein
VDHERQRDAAQVSIVTPAQTNLTSVPEGAAASGRGALSLGGISIAALVRPWPGMAGWPKLEGFAGLPRASAFFERLDESTKNIRRVLDLCRLPPGVSRALRGSEELRRLVKPSPSWAPGASQSGRPSLALRDVEAMSSVLDVPHDDVTVVEQSRATIVISSPRCPAELPTGAVVSPHAFEQEFAEIDRADVARVLDRYLSDPRPVLRALTAIQELPSEWLLERDLRKRTAVPMEAIRSHMERRATEHIGLSPKRYKKWVVIAYVRDRWTPR